MKPIQLLGGLLAILQVLFGVPWGVAMAQTPPPRVWLGPIEVDKSAGMGATILTEKFDEAARTRLKSSKVLESTEVQGVGPVSAGEADPRVEQAERLRVAGQEAFAAKEHEKALEQLGAALELYEEGLASVNKIDAIMTTMGYLGAAAVELGFDGDAKDYFKRVIALAPDAEPFDDYSEAAKKLFNKTRKRLQKKKKGGLEVRTEPPGAVVTVDGVEQGTSPVTVKGLLRGYHYVQARHESAGLAATRAKVKGGKTKKLDLALATEVGPEPVAKADPVVVAKLLELARAAEFKQEFEDAARAIAGQTRADYVVATQVRPQGNGFVLQAYLYGMKEKQVAALDELKFRAHLGSVRVQAVALIEALEKAAKDFPFHLVPKGEPKARVAVVPPPPDPKPEPEPEVAPPPDLPPMPGEEPIGGGLDDEPWKKAEVPPEDDDDPWYGAWWVWTLAGAAVIGGTAYGGYVLLQEETPSGSFDATVEWGNQ